MYKARYAYLNNENDENPVKYVTKSTYMLINTYNFKHITGIILNKAKHITGTLRSDMLNHNYPGRKHAHMLVLSDDS